MLKEKTIREGFIVENLDVSKFSGVSESFLHSCARGDKDEA